MLGLKSQNLTKFVDRFRDRGGNVSMLFGLTLVPIVTLAGAALDYSRASTSLAALQRAADATAIVLSKRAASLNATQLNQNAAASVAALFSSPGASLGAVTAAYSTASATTLTVNATANVTPSFMNLLGVTSLPVKVSSTATWGSTRLRVALVLDNTGSMAQDGKMDALKVAATNLLAQLQSSARTADDVYVSIIPFSKDVNVGASNKNASWIRWDVFAAGNPFFNWFPDYYKNSWNGCVTDRDQNYDTTSTAPSSLSTQFPAESYGSCPLQLTPLTNNWTLLNTQIAAMYPAGNTNQTIGLQWGFQSLQGSSPLTVPPKDSRYTYKEVVVLLTDGLNTENRFSTSQSAIDTRTLAACTAIKNAGITLYAYQVNTGSDPTSTMLQQCASDPAKSAVLTSGQAVISKFSEVATDLTALRISR